MRSFTAASHAATFLVKVQEGLMAPGCDDALRTAHVLRLSSVSTALQLPRTPSTDNQGTGTSSGSDVGTADMSPTEFDIHRDPCPGELAKMLCPPQGATHEAGGSAGGVAGTTRRWCCCCRSASACAGCPWVHRLMRAVTGLELLLAKAQGWQETAGSNVSLGAQLGPVASLVKRWRTLELSNWPRLLASCARQHEATAESLWFRSTTWCTAHGPQQRPGAAEGDGGGAPGVCGLRPRESLRSASAC